MADHTIYRFANATVIYSPRHMGKMTLLEDGVAVAELPDLLSEEVLTALGSYSHKIYAPTQGELELVRSSWTQDTLSYIPKDENSELRELDEETYNRISPNFQLRYKRKLADRVETRTPLEYELVSSPYALKGEVLIGREFVSELHSKIVPLRARATRNDSYYYNRDRLRASLQSNLPLSLTGGEIKVLIDGLGDEVARGKGYSASLHRYGYSEESDFNVTFYATPYEGAMKKVLDKKQNGQPYADRRGRMVRDLPRAVGQAKITSTDLASWWASVEGNRLSDDAKLEALRTLTNHLWRA